MTQEQLPTNFEVVTPTGNSPVSIEIQARKAILKEGVEPDENNAWVYRPHHKTSEMLANFLGPVISVKRGQEIDISWRNTLGEDPSAKPKSQQEAPPIDKGCMPGEMNDAMCPPFGIATHLHGGKVAGGSDGWPLLPIGYVGNAHSPTQRTFAYPNDQRASLLWYHDHTMDHTASNVYAGLAGLYVIRDATDDELFALIGGPHEIPLVIQDRLLADDGKSFDYHCGIPGGDNRAEFLGNKLFVNGRQSPRHDVERRVYRLRLLNGSNARTYALALYNPVNGKWHTDRLTLIGTEGGLLATPVTLANVPNRDNDTGYLVIASAERRDVLLDLSNLPKGVEHLQLVNLAVKSLADAIDHPDREITEAIYTIPTNSIIASADINDKIKALGVFGVMDLHLTGANHHKPANFDGRLKRLLLENASGDGFHWNHVTRKIEPVSWAVRKNRLVMLFNNTMKIQPKQPPEPNDFNSPSWDVRLCELGPETNGADGPEYPWLPFNVHLHHPLPADNDQPLTGKTYTIARRSFFQEPEAHCTNPPDYPPLHTPTIKPIAGTFERWYVANVGNETFDNPGGLGNAPDMHPLHIHLVNFIVTRRWRREDTTKPFKLSRDPLDGNARHDTIRVHPNEIVELILYFPKGYHGKYPYHCHLVEHEDMGMMLHFEVAYR